MPKNAPKTKAHRIQMVKDLNTSCINILDEMFAAGDDPRAIAIAKTQIETGFMWATRAVADNPTPEAE